MRTRRRRPTSRGPSPTAVVAALLAGLAVTTVGAPGASGSPDAGGRRAQATTIQLLEQDPWHHEADVFRMRVRVDGAPDGATVEIERHDPVRSRTRFTDSLSDDELGGPERTLSLVLTDLPLAPGGGVELAYPMADDEGLDSYGVYPIRVLVVDGDGSTLTELVTYLVVLPDARFPPLSVALLMEIGGPNGLQPDGTTALSDETQAAIAARIEVLQRTRLPVTVAPSPETLDALDELGGRGDLLLDELRTAVAGRTLLARPYVDLDLDALVAADLLTQLPPEAEAGAQVVRTKLDMEPVGGTWLSGPTIGRGAVDALTQVGTPQAVVPESAVASVPDLDADEAPTEPVALAEGGPLAFVADEALSTRLAGDAGPLDAQRFLAELAMIWLTSPSLERGVLVRLPESAAIDVDTVATALEAMAGGDAVRMVTTQQLFTELAPDDGDDAPVVELAPHSAGDDLRPLVDPLGKSQARVTALAGTLGDSRLIGSLARSLLLTLGADTPNTQRAAYIHRVDTVVADLADKVSAPDEFQITLTARDGTIPLTLTNDTGRDIVVKVHLSSNQLTFPGGTTRTVKLDPGNTWIDVDVRTRTSGAFPLDIRITSPDDTIVLDQTTFTIRSTAVSGVGLVLSAGAGLFLLIWWARNWRSAKRSRRLVAENGHIPG